MYIVYIMCNSFVSVVKAETGFRMKMLTISESDDSVEMCLATLGTSVMDTIITVTVMYDTAGEEGEMCDRSVSYILRREKYSVVIFMKTAQNKLQ